MILITGGLGFIGSHLAESLVNNGDKVILVSRSKLKEQNIAGFADKVIVEYVDVSHQAEMEALVLKYKPTVIFHLAGQPTSYGSFENPLYDLDANARSTLVLLEAIRKLDNPCKFILASTFWVVGKPERLPITEKTPCHPRNLYAANRLSSEHYCRIYSDVYGIDAVVMRLSNIYGARDQYDNSKKSALNRLLYQGYKGIPITIYRDNTKRDYVYVSDVVSAAQIIALKGKAGECYLVATGKSVSFFDIGAEISKLTRTAVTYIEPPEFHKKIDIGEITIDSSKLKALGWEAKVSLEEGMKRTLDHYKRKWGYES